jgi:hypothetical protein
MAKEIFASWQEEDVEQLVRLMSKYATALKSKIA